MLEPVESSGKPLPHESLCTNAKGGGYLEVSTQDDLATAFARVADELHAQYLLGYVPRRRTAMCTIRRPPEFRAASAALT
jgi:hypothetical protein